MDLVAERGSHRAHVVRIDQRHHSGGRFHARYPGGADTHLYPACGAGSDRVDPPAGPEDPRQDQAIQCTPGAELFTVDFETVRWGTKGQTPDAPGLAWGLFPILFAAGGLTIERIGILAAVYPAVWGGGQPVTGALSDRYGRKPLIVAGMLVQAAAMGMVAVRTGFGIWLTAAILLGAGTAMVYPTLLAAIGDVARPTWQARSVGIYRPWRDGGFAVGALLSGLLADAYGIPAAVAVVGALTALSGIIVALQMRGTDHTITR